MVRALDEGPDQHSSWEEQGQRAPGLDVEGEVGQGWALSTARFGQLVLAQQRTLLCRRQRPLALFLVVDGATEG
jgi:hypothetical protein